MAGRDGRARTWAFIVYPESAPEGWREMLAERVIPAAISPLHDRDTWTIADERAVPEHLAGTLKKPHYHVVLYYSSLKSPKQVLDDVAGLGVTHVEAINDTPAYNRYLCHLDQPGKAQYSVDDVVRLNGASCDMARVLSADERRAIRVAVSNHVREYNFTEYAELVYWCIDNEPDWATVVMGETIFFRGLLASVRAMRSRDREVSHG